MDELSGVGVGGCGVFSQVGSWLVWSQVGASGVVTS